MGDKIREKKKRKKEEAQQQWVEIAHYDRGCYYYYFLSSIIELWDINIDCGQILARRDKFFINMCLCVWLTKE